MLQRGATHDGTRDAIVIGASSGGIEAVSRVLTALPPDLDASIAVLLHVGENPSVYLTRILERACPFPVRFAEEKLHADRRTVFVGPPGYHLLVEADETFSLSRDEPVHCSRPSIDVLFESAADAWRERLIGVLLTGASADGALGTERIAQRGGYVIVQDPDEAVADCMPRAAIAAGMVDEVLALDAIGPRLALLTSAGRPDAEPRVRGKAGA